MPADPIAALDGEWTVDLGDGESNPWVLCDGRYVIEVWGDEDTGDEALARRIRDALAAPALLREELDTHHPVIELIGRDDMFIACSCGWDGLGPRCGWPKNRPSWEQHFIAALAAEGAS